MKKLILCLLFLVMLSLPAYAGVLTLLSGATGTGAGAAQWVKDNTVEVWSCDTIITGSPTAVTVRIEGNQSGTLYDPTGMGEHIFTATQLSAGIASFSIISSPVVNIRANVVTLTGGTSPTVTVNCGGRPI